MLKAECGQAAAPPPRAGVLPPASSLQPSSFRIQHSPFSLPSAFSIQPSAFRAAVTLIELLIGMVIMAILAAAILGTAAAAMEAGRRSRTQSTIAKIHNLIMDRLAEYETRRVELNVAAMGRVNGSNPSNLNDPARGKQLAVERLNGLRELMKYEMPDRWSDITVEPPLVLSRTPALAQAYRRRLAESNASTTYEGAECLYLTLMFACGDGEARTLFREQEIGDFDGDGAPEILDGWGRPISWLRWPAGFESPLHSMDVSADHDPFDVYRVDPDAYRLVPLIYSAGPDGALGINSEPPSLTDPYDATNGPLMGTVLSRNDALDNITNHLIEY